MPTKYTVEDAPAQSKYTVEDATPPPKSDTTAPRQDGFWSSAAKPFVDAATGAWHAVTDAPKNTTEKAVNLLGPGALPMKRAIIDPAIEQGKQAISEFQKANAETPWYSMHPSPTAVEHRELALGHGIAAAIPMLGPWAASVGQEEGEQIGAGNYKGAAGTAVGNLVLAAAPKIVGRARELAPRAVESVRKGAQSLVGVGEKPVKTIVAKEAVDAGEAAKKTIQANRDAAAKSATGMAEVKAANKEAVRAQSKIAPTQEKLKTAGRELQAQIETARNNALKEGNSKYNTVNATLNPIEADPNFYTDSLMSASESIKGSAPEPAFLKNIEKRIESGEPILYEDLQADYTRLGNELSKGTLPGDVYHAYDEMHENIGKEMQRIADSNGLGAQLTTARNYWRRMKQAFGRPYNPTDTGNTVLEKATGQGTAEEQANRVRLLGSFDSSIPQTVEHIGNLRKGLDALPDTKPLRDVVKPLPAKSEPKQIHAPEVNTRAIRENLLDRWTSGEQQLSKFQVRSLVGGGLGVVVGGLFEGRIGAEVGGVVGTVFGPAAISRLVETPAVREWLTRPPAGELETLRKLPSADRLRITDTLKKVVEQSAKTGKPIKVSPAVTALILGASQLGPRKNATDEWAGTGVQ